MKQGPTMTVFISSLFSDSKPDRIILQITMVLVSKYKFEIKHLKDFELYKLHSI